MQIGLSLGGSKHGGRKVAAVPRPWRRTRSRIDLRSRSACDARCLSSALTEVALFELLGEAHLVRQSAVVVDRAASGEQRESGGAR